MLICHLSSKTQRYSEICAQAVRWKKREQGQNPAARRDYLGAVNNGWGVPCSPLCFGNDGDGSLDNSLFVSVDLNMF